MNRSPEGSPTRRSWRSSDGSYGINAAGQIVGAYLGEDDVFHGFLRDHEDD